MSSLPIKAYFRVVRNTVEPDQIQTKKVFHYSLPIWHETHDGQIENPSDLASLKLALKGGEVLVSKLNPEKGAVIHTRQNDLPIIASSEFIAFQPRLGDQRYGYWLMQSAPVRRQLEASVESATQSHRRARVDRFLASHVSVPDLPTQRRIAAFLDRETARIDELIAKKERLVEILKEREAAALEEVLWGDGPETKLGYHISILPGYAFSSDRFSDNPDDIRLLRGANVGVNEVRWSDTVYWPTNDAVGLERFHLSAGDIVMGMDRPWISGGIRVAQIQEKDLPCILLQRVCKIAPLSTLNGRYLKAMIESKRFVAYFEPILTGVGVPHISGDQIANFRFPFMPIEDQERRMDSIRPV